MLTKLYAGIDISATDATLCCLDSAGKQLQPSQSFENNLSGAAQIADVLVNFGAKEIHVGLESTSVYGAHLRDFLLTSPLLQDGCFVYEINPALVNGFKRSFPKKPKTDNVDAWLIAERVRFGHLRPFSEKRLTTQPLLQLTRYRLHLIKLLTMEQNRACNLIFLKFSNYRKDNPFSNTFGKASLAVLGDLFPDDLINMDLEQLVTFITQNGNNRLNDPENMAKELKTIASNAYRLNPKMKDSVHVALAMTIQNIEYFKNQVKRLDKLIARELKAIPQTLDTIPGIGPVFAAGIVTEIGDISRFDNEASLAQYAGLTWSRYQSGNFDAEERRLTKAGNRYLRYYLVEAANSLRVHNEEYKAYYYSKYKEVNKHQHKRALVLTARKFVRLVFALLSKGQIYQKQEVEM